MTVSTFKPKSDDPQQIVCFCEHNKVDPEDEKNGVSPSIFKLYDNGDVECVECGSTYRWKEERWMG